MVDLGNEKKLSFVFIEVVATDGPITSARQEAFYQINDNGGYDRSHVLFVTAYLDRQSNAFKKTIPEVAWNSFAWFASELTIYSSSKKLRLN